MSILNLIIKTWPLWLVRKDMDVNEHERITNITFRHNIKKWNSVYTKFHRRVFNKPYPQLYNIACSRAVRFTSVDKRYIRYVELNWKNILFVWFILFQRLDFFFPIMHEHWYSLAITTASLMLQYFNQYRWIAWTNRIKKNN